TCAHLKKPFVAQEHTTLNEKFDVQKNVTLNTGEMPSLGYWTIGNGGHKVQIGAQGFPKITPIDHQADHAALYSHLPFVLRDPTNDLPPATRDKYALRKEVSVEGRTYIAYYLKRLDLGETSVHLKRTQVADGVRTVTEYIPTSANLSPIAPSISNVGTVTTSGEYLSFSATITIVFDEFDVQELLNVANILYGDESYAVISEIGLCTGVDRTVAAQGQSGQFNYREVLSCQVAAFIPVHYEMIFHSQGFTYMSEVGAVEPLLGAVSMASGAVSG